MSELLMPAGNIEKMKYAYAYGADAVYLGLVDYSLRTMRKGELITRENLKSAIDLARSLSKKAYLTLNIFAYDDDIKSLHETLDVIQEAKPHAIILSDFGVYNVVKNNLKDIEIHISTQTNILNSETVKFWRDLGATRAIFARELSLKQIEEIKKNVPDMELEVFVHGSQCMSYSGRCLLSDYMTDGQRQANHGACAQPCRWSYKLVEETRPNEYYEIEQNSRGTHILSPKDLCLINHMENLKNVGVDSFKIEGRTKSLYYVSAVTKAYRAVMDKKITPLEGFNDLRKVGNRGFTEGFFLGDNNSDSYSYEISKGLAGADYLCYFLEKDENGYRVKIKNKINLKDEFEIITPDYTSKVLVEAITTEKGESVEVANTNDEIYLKLSGENAWEEQWNWALGRTIGIKNEN